MSYAPDTLKAARTLYIDKLRALGYNIDPLSVGIVGDDSHAASGTSYHLGKDALKSSSYSIVESSRDRNGLTNGAAAIDFGWFSVKAGGVTHNLRTFSAWLVAQCKAGAADTLDIREIIYSLDGVTVKRWDRLGIRSTGDSSHTEHTHVSYFRDSESRAKTPLINRYFASLTGGGTTTTEDDMPLTNDDADLVIDRLLARKIITGSGTTQNDYGTLNGVMGTLMARTGNLANSYAPAWSDALNAILANVRADDADKAQIIAAVEAAKAATAQAAADAVRDTFGGADADPADVAAALKAALGADKWAAVKAAG
jgi:hypothetical protein